METPYTYKLVDFLNGKVNIKTLDLEIRKSDIVQGVIGISVINSNCIIVFKGDELSSGDLGILDYIVSSHVGVHTEDSAPVMPDGRPIVRADTRPLDTETVFTTCGDDQGIGDGKELRWDFSNDDDLYTGSEVPSGYKAKEILLSFICPVYLKDGTIYFFDAPWGQYMTMEIVVPANGYYPNPQGQIPAYMLGLSGYDMYSQAPSSSNVTYQKYVNKQFSYGSCPMGDELNAEGCAINALPVGWMLRGLIVTPEDDNTSKGYASLEMYRCHSVLLPGQTKDNVH